jgi:hypothetical protein
MEIAVLMCNTSLLYITLLYIELIVMMGVVRSRRRSRSNWHTFRKKNRRTAAQQEAAQQSAAAQQEAAQQSAAARCSNHLPCIHYPGT